MRNNRGFMLLLISFVISVIAVVLIVRWTHNQINQKVASSLRPIVVALRDIPPGIQITRDMVTQIDWPVNSMISGSSSDPNKFVGRITKQLIVTKEPILEQKLAELGAKAGLASEINNGKRAFSVKVTEISGVAGFALPGNYVDVIVNLQQQNGQGRFLSKILLQHILVLAVAQDDVLKDGVKSKVVNTVTLEVTPHEAEQLDLARSSGNISLALRNQNDKSINENIQGFSNSQIYQGSPSSTVSIGSKDQHSSNAIEVIHGTQRSFMKAVE